MEKMSENLKVAIVTGASSGIGLRTAIALVGQGYRVWAVARNLEKLKALAGEYQQIEPYVVDLSDPDQVEAFCREINRQNNSVDVLISNAGYSLRGVIENVPLDQIKSLFEVNVFALVRITQTCLSKMRPRRAGTIINISSIAGKLTFPGNGPYAASKHAVEAFTDAMRHELSPMGIRIVSIRPAFIDTEFNAVANQMSAEFVPDAAADYQRISTIAQEKINTMWSELKRLDPEAVADLIMEIIKSDNPRAAYAIGPTAEEFLSQRMGLNDDEWKEFLDKKMGLFDLKL
jgi:NADP-dependent 3-hydroxy acid dehydrogenase YdfG